MKKKLILFLIILFQIGLPCPLEADSTIKIGIYSNEPLIFIDKDGRGKGFFADIIEYIASKEGWQIEYVPGTWAQCLSRLENNQIDILCNIAFSRNRDKLYDFNTESVLTNWGELYTFKNSDITAVTDLTDKKVAVLKGDIHTAVFKKIISEFGIQCELIETDDYHSVLDLVSRKIVDAGVVNRFFGLKNKNRYNVERSGAIFNPIRIQYAVPEGKNSELIAAIDSYLKLVKNDEESVYYQSFERYFDSVSIKFRFPLWGKWAISVTMGIAVFLFLGSLFLRTQVKVKTEELGKELKHRKKTEIQLSESERLFRFLTENAKDMIYKMSLPDGRYEYVSPAVTEVFGYAPEELLSSPLFIQKIIHPDWYDYFKEQWELLLAGDMPPSYEYQIVHGKSGETRWINQRNVLIQNDQGKPITIEGIVTDITERKQVEEALRTESDNLKNIFEAMEDGIYIVNSQYDIQYVNTVLTKTFGMYEGRKCYEYFHDRSETCPWCKSPDVFAGKTVHWEWYSSRNQRTYDLIDTPLKNPDGTISKLEIFRDITERKQAEEELEKHRGHLEEMVKERTEDLQKVINAMSGREVRMAELKKENKKLQEQLKNGGSVSQENK